MRVADVARNQDSGTDIVTVDRWPAEGFVPGHSVLVGERVWTIVRQFPLLRQVEITAPRYEDA